MTAKISVEQLIDFFKNSKREYWIGLQNFQGIQEYTQIPLAPITLLYGQNSAGKSTIHDAMQFIHCFFGGKWDEQTTKKYLDRWANYHRSSSPLTHGYLGNPDDVILSISVLGIDGMIVSEAFFEWERCNIMDRRSDVYSPASYLFTAIDEAFPFQIYIHFSNCWDIRKFSLILGEINLIDFEVDQEITNKYSVRINKHNLIFTFLDSFFENGIEDVLDFICSDNVEIINDNQCIGFSNYRNSFEGGVKWKQPVNWISMDEEGFFESGFNRFDNSKELQWLRELINSLLIVPTIAASRRLDFISIPPLRPIPTKHTAIFRKGTSEPDQYEQGLECWSKLAAQVCTQLLAGYFNITPQETYYFLGDRGSQLGYINRFLSHPDFLDTDYEISGECLFLTPIGTFQEYASINNEEMYALLDKLDSEIHLKIRQKSNGNLLEIEDVGVGISQIIPVLYAITTNNSYIQQPELHLHPKLQAQLADAFIERNNKKRDLGCYFPLFVIESHSEHFLLRLLRRIRETYKSDIKHKLFSLYPEDVSVIYVDKLADGSSKVIPLRISKDGDFIDRWPHGFFTERDGELFDE